jgi:ribosomal protein S18 acetylase RimI-like enzyme
MEMANRTDDERMSCVRRATVEDAAAIQRLLQMGVYAHTHNDWRLPGEWLGRPGFAVFDTAVRAGNSHAFSRRKPQPLSACLAVAADPPPAAWVRVAAVQSRAAYTQVREMFDQVLAELPPDVTEIAWFLTAYWPPHWLERLGFAPVSEVVSMRKRDLSAPAASMPRGLQVRPLLIEDLPVLEAIEAAAFAPRWRHSADNLFRAWRQSISFDVALLDGLPVAFQYSTGGEGAAHLSRMAVQPDRQGLGIGAALLAHVLKNYRLQNIREVTLNTQADNSASHRLYERFGFRPTGSSYPVWSYYRDGNPITRSDKEKANGTQKTDFG